MDGDLSVVRVGKPGTSGAFFDHRFAVVAGVTSISYEIGAGGAGGIGDNVGADGSGPTQVTYNSVTVGGNPGEGGFGIHPTDVPSQRSNALTAPTVIGTPDLGSPGKLGGLGMIMSTENFVAGHGGPNFFGFCANGPADTSGVGANGSDGVDGGGGSGGAVGGASSSSRTGGDGGAGILIIDEYS